MSYSFKTPQAKPAFAMYKEPIDAGQYVLYKKNRATFCNSGVCPGTPKVNSQGYLRSLNTAQLLDKKCLQLPFSNADLNNNLVTTLDLQGVCTVEDMSKNCNITIDNTMPFFTTYNIDPNGALFGNDNFKNGNNMFGEATCGANNYLQYLVYNNMVSSYKK